MNLSDEIDKLRAEEDRINQCSDQMRQRSGAVDSDDKLVSFLYVLMRDNLAPGIIESILLKQCSSEMTQYSNGWLATYAKDIASRLRGEVND